MKLVYFIPILIFFVLTPAFAYNSGFRPVYQPSLPPGGISNIHDIGNVTSIGCAIGQFLSVNASAIWACASGGSGESNTASSSGVGESLVLPKVGVDLPFKGIWVSGDLTISSNATDITIGHLGDVSSLRVNNQTSQKDVFITGINNATGVITTNQFSINNSTCTGNTFLQQLNNVTGFTVCATPTSSASSLKIDNQTQTKGNFLTAFNNATGDWTRQIFKVNNQTINGGDTFIQGINNQTGVITKKTFSVNTKACSGTDKVSSIDNSTGDVICTTDSSSGTARESLVAYWPIDRTWANIGVTFVNVYTTGVGDPVRIDTNGKTTATLMIDWTKVGAGTQKCKIAQVNAEGTILIMATNLISGVNTNATVSIPVAQQNTIANYKVMCLSSTSTDDPVFLTGQILLR